ncbi:MAG: hypothetical protein EXR21_02810 [Flavobacteriaceae bacterium]|nr:hypothetical protein [Flavobacteriaceae bacterium]
MKKYLLLLLPWQAMAQADADSSNWFRINTNFIENPATVGENGKNILTFDFASNSTFNDDLGLAFQTSEIKTVNGNLILLATIPFATNTAFDITT